MTTIAFTPNLWKIQKIQQDIESGLNSVTKSYVGINTDEVLTDQLLSARQSLEKALQGIDLFLSKSDESPAAP